MATAKRRGYREGSISQRSNGLWEGRYYDQGGNRRSVYARRREDVSRKLRDAMYGADRGRELPKAVSVDKYLEDWLSRAELRPSTLRRYKSICAGQLVPHLGGVKLAALRPADVDRLLAALRSQGLSPYTVTHVRSVLRAALSDAERNGLVERNAAKLARAPHLPQVEPIVLTPAAVRLVLDACPPGLRRLVVLAIDTGLRQGEELGLRWADVDFEEHCLYVRSTLERVGKEYRLGEPKSATSRRTVALSDLSLDALREERDAQALTSRPSVIPDLVFTTPNGQPRNGSSVLHGFQDALEAAHLARLRWHDLRAIHAGLLVQAEASMSTVRDRLGHSSITTSSKFYTGVVTALQRKAADDVGRLLAG